jgi:hypothetical protein
MNARARSTIEAIHPNVVLFLRLGAAAAGVAMRDPLPAGPWYLEAKKQTDQGKTRNEEGPMCPACIANTAVMAAGVGSTGGVLAVCIGKFRKVLRAKGLGRLQKTKEK